MYAVLLLFCASISIGAADNDACQAQPYGGGEMDGPSAGQSASEYLTTIRAFKTACRAQLKWGHPSEDPAIYQKEALRWTQTSYIQPQVHPFDQYLYDKTSHQYTVDRYLKDVKNRYGGIDAVLLWPTYTNIGVDDRNQFDYIRAMPGGMNATTQLVADFKKAGVRVLWPYNPWDTGTTTPKDTDEEVLAGIIAATHADGFNGDTMASIPYSFYKAGLESQNISIAMEPEGGGGGDPVSFNWDTIGWGEAW
jgi:hypothetical protein